MEINIQFLGGLGIFLFGILAIIVTKLIPGEDTYAEFKAKHLDPVFIEQSPSIALGQAKEEVLRMGNFALKGMEEVQNYLKSNQRKHADTALRIEDAINNLDRKITDYLVDLATSSLSEQESEEHTSLINTVRDIERIGDHFENIVELIEYQQTNKVKITDSAMKDLEEMFAFTISTVKEAIHCLDHKDKEEATDVVKREEEIDRMERKLRKQHFLRMNEELCTGQAGIVYVDIISNLARIGDHAVNIAKSVLGERH